MSKINVASIQVNLTGQHWGQNLQLIYQAISKAVENNIDIMLFSELTLSTPDCRDYFQYSDNIKTLELLQLIADYAYQKNPDLVISIGHPWFFADQELVDCEIKEKQSVSLFNRRNIPFNVQTLIQNGTILSMSAKDSFDENERYESRHFSKWDHTQSSISIKLDKIIIYSFDGRHEIEERIIPFGKPVTSVTIKGQNITLYHLIGNTAVEIFVAIESKESLMDIILNPTATLPGPYELLEKKQKSVLEALNARAKIFVSSGAYGNAGGDYSFQGEYIFAFKDEQRAKILSIGYAGFEDLHITNGIFKILKCCAKSDSIEQTVNYNSLHDYNILLQIKHDAQWLFDYLRKSGLKTLVLAYTDELRTFYTIAKIRLMVDLIGPEIFYEKIGYTDIKSTDDREANIYIIMRSLLVCICCIDRSINKDELKRLKDFVEKFGVKFQSYYIDATLEKCVSFETKVNLDKLTLEQKSIFLNGIKACLYNENKELLPTLKSRLISDLSKFEISIPGRILSLADDNDRRVIHSIKERLVSTVTLTMGNTIPASVGITSTTLDDLCMNKSIFGGRLHSGQLGINEDKWLAEIIEQVTYMNRKKGIYHNAFSHILHEHEEQQAKQIQYIFFHILRKTHADGRKYNPIEVFRACRESALFSVYSTEEIYNQIKSCYINWKHSQLYIHAAPLSSNYNLQSVSHETGLRTPNVNGFHMAELSQLVLYCLDLENSTELYNRYKDSLLIDRSAANKLLSQETLYNCKKLIDEGELFSTRPSTMSYTLSKVINEKVECIKEVRASDVMKFKIATASCNQTGNDWSRNFNNILQAIDKAVEDGADLLCFQELALSGYACDDYFAYTDNEVIYKLLHMIASYSALKSPNLILSIGHPWRLNQYENPIEPTSVKPFNVQTLISMGKVISISAKSYLFNEERGYEEHYFQEWNNHTANTHGGINGCIDITLPEISYYSCEQLVNVSAEIVKFGSPVTNVQIKGNTNGLITLFHVICEESWIGSYYHKGDSLTYDRDNPLALKSKEQRINIAINPNASPPSRNKLDKHLGLAIQGSRYCDVFAHVNCLGTESSAMACFGTAIIARNGDIILESAPLNMNDISYASCVVEIPALDSINDYNPTIIHELSCSTSMAVDDSWICKIKKYERDKLLAEYVDDETITAKIYDRVELELELRSELLWMFDMLRKSGLHGFVQALSGGADSAYNAVKVRLMVQLVIKERSLKGFLDALNFSEKIKLSIYDKWPIALDSINDGIDLFDDQIQNAVDFIMHFMLKSYYLATPNNSQTTLKAATTLIKGGEYRCDSHTIQFRGIGGEFELYNIQPVVDELLLMLTGIDPESLDSSKHALLLDKLRFFASLRRDDLLAIYMDLILKNDSSKLHEITGDFSINIHTKQELEAKLTTELVDYFQQIINDICEHDVVKIILSPLNPMHGLAVENMQARVRLILIYLIADLINTNNPDHLVFELMVNPNQSEGRNSYTTFGGDLHSGRLSFNSHKEKAHQLSQMEFIRDYGLYGMPSIKALHYILSDNKPSAELQGKSYSVTDAVVQYDEASLGRTYEEMLVMAHQMFHANSLLYPMRKQNPCEVFDACSKHKVFSNTSIADLHDQIIKAYKYWPTALHKLRSTPNGQTYGENIDPKISMPTPCLNAYHIPELAELTLYCLSQMVIKNGISFEEFTGMSLNFCLQQARTNELFDQKIDSLLWTEVDFNHLGLGRERKLAHLYEKLQKNPGIMSSFFIKESI